MRLGITALLTDRTPGPATVAAAAEERGFDALYLPEHTHLPVRADVPPGAVGGVAPEDYRRTIDPMVALGAAAAVTSRLRLGTGVLLVAQHDPVVLAKQVATLDHLSGGRVVLGVGFGWNAAEAADHGVDFRTRRERAADHVACLRALWQGAPAEHHGPFADLPPSWSWPKPVRGPALPVLVGGGAGPRLLQAVADWGDGWMPIGSAGLGPAMADLGARVEAADRDPSAVVVVPFGVLPTDGKLEHLAALGVREVVLRVPTGPGTDVLGTLDAYAAFVDRFAAA